jgi:hypothetical protein
VWGRRRLQVNPLCLRVDNHPGPGHSERHGQMNRQLNLLHKYCVFRKFTRLAARNQHCADCVLWVLIKGHGHTFALTTTSYTSQLGLGQPSHRPGFPPDSHVTPNPQNPGYRILAAHPLHVGDPRDKRAASASARLLPSGCSRDAIADACRVSVKLLRGGFRDYRVGPLCPCGAWHGSWTLTMDGGGVTSLNPVSRLLSWGFGVAPKPLVYRRISAVRCITPFVHLLELGNRPRQNESFSNLARCSNPIHPPIMYPSIRNGISRWFVSVAPRRDSELWSAVKHSDPSHTGNCTQPHDGISGFHAWQPGAWEPGEFLDQQGARCLRCNL